MVLGVILEVDTLATLCYPEALRCHAGARRILLD